ncbi:hypothetical protein BV22DRAFT_1131225 [Leucogyrophana mollusca]|uniref:Uncharacterized protein n=1 Tax=Leucogyrophana mollusca TaxID=85980 RepID=A0ACB8BAK5_9AGAM|nr:hypothetical protein BV22DRAFT_1131225 [Leucogyrophana mollusca]
MRDEKEYQECSPDDLLAEFLYDCKDPKVPIDKASLYGGCLKAVLPICNGEYSRKTVDPVESSGIRAALDIYVKSQPRTGRYAPFVEAANCALQCLGDLVPHGLMRAADWNDHSNILFYRSELKVKHQGCVSGCKPAVVITSWATAVNAREDVGPVGKKSDVYMTYASKPPDKAFEWEDVRCAVEFKATKRTLDRAPTRYEVKDYAKPSNPFLSVSVLKELEYADLELTSVVEASSSAAGTPSNTHVDSREDKAETPANDLPPSGLVSRNQSDRKRAAEDAPLNQPEGKRAKPSPPASQPDQSFAIIQSDMYAAEMFAAHLGTHHAINLIIISYWHPDDIVYVWRYDRQGTIQCSGINFVQDLPRFLVLLLAMQRFGDNQWGRNEQFKAKKSGDERWYTIRVDDHPNPVELRLPLSARGRAFHSGLKGRATNVLPVTLRPLSKPHENTSQGTDYPQHNMTEELVIKLFWPGDGRESEENILKKVYEIAKDDPEVDEHAPELVWAHRFTSTSTAAIRLTSKIANPYKDAHTLCGIVFRRLLPITDLSEEVFLRTWWQAAQCHHKLWKGGVHHRDISVNNLKYYLDDNQPVGVINDFDLALTKQGPTGTERIGTVPFMALELLSKSGRDGHITQIYQHDAEALLWLLVWVSLRYDKGTPIRRNTPLDDWLKVDATGCRKEKSDWLTGGRHLATPSPSHVVSWKVARLAFDTLYLHYGRPCVVKPDDLVFTGWFQENVGQYLD